MRIKETYLIEPTKKTPLIKFDKNAGELEVGGKSLPEYAYKFYNQLLEEVDDYMNEPQNKTKLTFKIDYFNSISSKIIMQLISKFEKLVDMGKVVEVDWHYSEEDDIMYEVGEVFKTSTKVMVNLIRA